MISVMPIAVPHSLLWICIFFAVWVTLFQANANELTERKNIVLSGISDNDFDALMWDIIKEAYSRIGYDAEVVRFPAKRSLFESSNGFVDGEVGRIFSAGEHYKTLVRVPTPFMFIKGAVYALKSDVKISSKEDLAKYTSGTLRGTIYSDQLTEGYSRIHGDSAAQLFAMLLENRVDLVIVSELTGRLAIAKGFSNQGIRTEMDSLVNIPIYHYLHERNSHIVPLLEPTLKEMFESGESARMKEAFIQERILKAKGSD